MTHENKRQGRRGELLRKEVMAQRVGLWLKGPASMAGHGPLAAHEGGYPQPPAEQQSRQAAGKP